MALRIPPRPTDGIATITLSQPDNKNALSTELVDALGDRLMSAEADEAVRCVMLTNEGKTPSARAPTSIKGKATAPPSPLAGRLDGRDRRLPEAGHRPNSRPLHGRGGVGLAASCDISVHGGTDDAKIGFLFYLYYGSRVTMYRT